VCSLLFLQRPEQRRAELLYKSARNHALCCRCFFCRDQSRAEQNCDRILLEILLGAFVVFSPERRDRPQQAKHPKNRLKEAQERSTTTQQHHIKEAQERSTTTQNNHIKEAQERSATTTKAHRRSTGEIGHNHKSTSKKHRRNRSQPKRTSKKHRRDRSQRKKHIEEAQERSIATTKAHRRSTGEIDRNQKSTSKKHRRDRSQPKKAHQRSTGSIDHCFQTHSGSREQILIWAQNVFENTVKPQYALV